MTSTLILLRHGQSEWNRRNLFTGWVDVDLTDQGRVEATAGGEQMLAANVLPTVVHTSLQVRAIRTAEMALDAMGRKWLPVRRSWRLNERHYGDLQGKDKKETVAKYGAEQVMLWRRSFDTPPPPMDIADPNSGIDDRYAALPNDVLPRAECLQDVIIRMLPYWHDAIVDDLRHGHTVLVAAHGNSLRGLVKHLEGMSAEAVISLIIPTGLPLVYELDDDLQPLRKETDLGVRGQYLDRAAAAVAIEGVKAQTA